MQLLLRIYAKMRDFKFLSLFSVSLSLEINQFLNQLLIAMVFNASCRNHLVSSCKSFILSTICHLPQSNTITATTYVYSTQPWSWNSCCKIFAGQIWAYFRIGAVILSSTIMCLSVDILIIRTKSSSILSHTIFPA